MANCFFFILTCMKIKHRKSSRTLNEHDLSRNFLYFWTFHLFVLIALNGSDIIHYKYFIASEKEEESFRNSEKKVRKKWVYTCLNSIYHVRKKFNLFSKNFVGRLCPKKTKKKSHTHQINKINGVEREGETVKYTRSKGNFSTKLF